MAMPMHWLHILEMKKRFRFLAKEQVFLFIAIDDCRLTHGLYD
jgi:hypothetical protein